LEVSTTAAKDREIEGDQTVIIVQRGGLVYFEETMFFICKPNRKIDLISLAYFFL